MKLHKCKVRLMNHEKLINPSKTRAYMYRNVFVVSGMTEFVGWCSRMPNIKRKVRDDWKTMFRMLYSWEGEE